MHYSFLRNPYHYPNNHRRNAGKHGMTKSERTNYKKYLLLERFFEILSLKTLQEIADTWVDPILKKIKSKARLIDALLEDEDLVKNATAPASADGVVLFTLKHTATDEEIDDLLDILQIDRKSTDTLTHKAILESLKLVTTAPLADVAAYRQEAIKWRKGKALEKARGVRSKKAAKKRKITQQEAEKARKAEARLAKREAREAEKAKRAEERLAKRARREKLKAREAKRKAREKEIAKQKKARALVRAKTRQQPQIALVADYLFEAEKAAYLGKKLGMKAYCQSKGISDYVGFTRKVKEHRSTARPQAHSSFLVWKDKYENPLYRQHVIDYLALSEFRKAEGVLSKKAFTEEKGLDYKTFSKYYTQFRHDAKVQAEARKMFFDLEAGRLSDLRAPEKPKEVAAFERLFTPPEKPKPKLPDLILLEKLAKKKLPVRKGFPVFSKDSRENNEKMEMWLSIADDVMEIGLSAPVAEKYLDEFGLPPSLSHEQQIRLVLLRMRTVLTQLDVFDPSKEHLTFSRLRAWKEGRDAKKAAKAERLAEKARQKLPAESPKLSSEDIYNEEWLIAELAREEAEARRYLTTTEEKQRRKKLGLYYSGDLSRQLIDTLKQQGAIYEDGEWLLPDEDALQLIRDEVGEESELAGWGHSRKPKLLVGIGTQDYTKDWMHHFFEIKTVRTASAAKSALRTFTPDAMMLYVSSTGSSFHRAFTEEARNAELPLIIFDKGFSDAVQSAEKQGILWFIDAFNKKRTTRRLLRRYNPYYKVRSNPVNYSYSPRRRLHRNYRRFNPW